MKEKMVRARTWLKNNIDLNDVFVFGGLALACYGIGQVHAPSAFIAGGAALVWLGKF